MSTPGKAAIHDLGYQRYVGSRRPQSTRYQVIVRNLVSMSWKGWWRYKLSLGSGLMIVVGIGVAMYLSRLDVLQGSPIGSQMRTMADSLIPESYGYLGMAAVTLNLTVLSGAIAHDLKAGAFEFYFSRPVRPIDYVIGKVGGAFVLLAPILLIAPFLLTVYRMAITGDMNQVTAALPWLPKALLVGVVATMANACLALSFGAMSKNPRYAVAGYGAFIFIGGGMIMTLSIVLELPWLAALDLASAIKGFANGIFGVSFAFGDKVPSLLASTLSIVGYVSVSIFFILYRIKAAQRAGMGGG